MLERPVALHHLTSAVSGVLSVLSVTVTAVDLEMIFYPEGLFGAACVISDKYESTESPRCVTIDSLRAVRLFNFMMTYDGERLES